MLKKRLRTIDGDVLRSHSTKQVALICTPPVCDRPNELAYILVSLAFICTRWPYSIVSQNQSSAHQFITNTNTVLLSDGIACGLRILSEMLSNTHSSEHTAAWIGRLKCHTWMDKFSFFYFSVCIIGAYIFLEVMVLVYHQYGSMRMRQIQEQKMVKSHRLIWFLRCLYHRRFFQNVLKEVTEFQQRGLVDFNHLDEKSNENKWHFLVEYLLIICVFAAIKRFATITKRFSLSPHTPRVLMCSCEKSSNGNCRKFNLKMWNTLFGPCDAPVILKNAKWSYWQTRDAIFSLVSLSQHSMGDYWIFHIWNMPFFADKVNVSLAKIHVCSQNHFI